MSLLKWWYQNQINIKLGCLFALDLDSELEVSIALSPVPTHIRSYLIVWDYIVTCVEIRVCTCVVTGSVALLCQGLILICSHSKCLGMSDMLCKYKRQNKRKNEFLNYLLGSSGVLNIALLTTSSLYCQS